MNSLLIVFNSNTEVQNLAEAISQREHENITLLSTHHLFEHEKEWLKTHCSNKSLSFIHFGTFNSSEALLNIDRSSYEKNKGLLKYNYLYINNFKLDLLRLKNEYIHKSLSQTIGNHDTLVFSSTYSINNLGISYEYWSTIGAKIVSTKGNWYKLKTFLQTSFFGKMVYHIKAVIRAHTPLQYFQIKLDGMDWHFYSLKRIHLKDEVQATKKWGRPFYISRKKESVSAIGLHDSGKALNMLPYISSKNLHIIGDAFRPTVYPPYLFAYAFLEAGTYIPKDKIDAEFFASAGLNVAKNRPQFLAKESFEIIKSEPPKVKTIVLSLNHAGDWSALINRSDTDILIEAFCEISKLHPSLQFVIRLHPTMTGPRAEGINSRKRVEQYVKSLSQSNLSISTVSLQDDWERGDLFISEYSLSVIDAIKRGKMGIFCNLTNRLSFMKDWVEMGMLEVNSIAELNRMISEALEGESVFYSNQKALIKYNKEKAY